MDGKEDLAALWAFVLASLHTRHDVSAPDMAFMRLGKPLGIIDDTLLIAVPSNLVKDRMEIRMRGPLTELLRSAPGTAIERFAITIDPSLEDSEPEPQEDEEEPDILLPPSDSTPGPRPGLATPLNADSSRLNPKYTFDTFVIGASNRFAAAAARAVSEAPATAYNPLFIYGGSGLGKTHLLHAIGHYIRHLNSHLRIRYVNSEEFTNDFINSIRDDRSERFQRRYRNVDVLLVDDIQFLGGKEQTVEEFFHTFNTLHNDQKQVVITSDTPPKDLKGFEDRLISRFEWGLLTDVQPPDLETRIAILRWKARADDLKASDEVLSFIASRVSTNIRELEGALIRVTAFANLNRQPLELPLAEVILRDLVSNDDVRAITPALIMKETADYFSISVELMTSPDRSRVPAFARQVAMYLCRELTDLSLPRIGETLGGRDHTTVIYGYRKIEQSMQQKRVVYNQVTELTARIRQHARSQNNS